MSPDPRRWRILALLCIAEFMVILDVTVVNVALPTIGDDLALAAGDLPWLVAAYTLPFASLLLLGGRLADLIGRRVVLVAGLALFTGASLASGLAQSSEALIAARIAQGAGAALLAPAALSVIAVLFTEPGERHRALATWSGVAAAGGAVGVLLGGVLTELAGWRSVFLINVPVGVAGVALTLAWLDRMRAPARDARRLDLPGALLAVVAFGGLVLAANRGGAVGWDATITWAALVAGVAALAGFVLVESHAPAPLAPLAVLRRRTVMAGGGLMLIGAGTLIAAFYLSSLHLQRGLGYDALETGLAFLPVSIAIAAGAHAGGRLAPRVGARALTAGGLTVAAAGALLLATTLDGNGYLAGVLPGFALLGVGLGSCFVAATTTAMSEIGDADAGLASGLSNTAHELGASLGVALLGGIAAGGGAADVETAFAVAGALIASAALLAALAFPRVAIGDRPALGHH